MKLLAMTPLRASQFCTVARGALVPIVTRCGAIIGGFVGSAIPRYERVDGDIARLDQGLAVSRSAARALGSHGRHLEHHDDGAGEADPPRVEAPP